LGIAGTLGQAGEGVGESEQLQLDGDNGQTSTAASKPGIGGSR
jgi:hypothetical protein